MTTKVDTLPQSFWLAYSDVKMHAEFVALQGNAITTERAIALTSGAIDKKGACVEVLKKGYTPEGLNALTHMQGLVDALLTFCEGRRNEEMMHAV